MSEYGGFDDVGRFVINDPRTPEPWLHYLLRPGRPGMETFCSAVTNACGGFDVRGTHENTFVDARIHLNDRDDMGRYVYVKDAESGETWSTAWQPLRRRGQEFTTAFGFGSAVFESSFLGIETRVEMFVPLEFDGWIQDIVVRNAGPVARRLELYPFVPVHMGDALERLLAGDNDAFFGGAAFDRDLRGIVFRRHHGIPVADDPAEISGMLGNVALFLCTLNDESTPYETDLERFLGDRFRGLEDPIGIERSALSSTDTPYLRRACGAFKNEVALGPREEVSLAVAFIAGSTADYYRRGKGELVRLAASVADASARRRMARSAAAWWRDRMSSLEVRTPRPELDRAFPWLQYQCEVVLALNRMKSRYHSGYEYGWGFRDILQDVLYLLPYRPLDMKDRLLRIAAQVFSTGQAYHNFFISQRGNKDIEASDDPLWFVQAAVRYCRETGDLAFLRERVDYADGKEGLGARDGTVLEHCVACLERVIRDRGPRGLPWMKDCDWNDDLNEERSGGEPPRSYESVMVGQQLYAALTDFASMLDRSGERGEADRYLGLAIDTKDALLRHGLDPAGYFKRALDATGRGRDLGTSASAEGRIFLETQVFAITCGVADRALGEALLAAVEEYLDTPWGAMLCYPHFRGLAERGELPESSWNIAKEPPGIKENGGVFMHLNAWLVEAYCRMGKGRKAMDLYLKTLPESLSRDQERYRAEPYVYPEYVRGSGAVGEGRGGHTWLTGTAPTMHAALTERVLGMRPRWEGLEVDPCVPGDWREFSMTRLFRGGRYRIRVLNPDGVERGVASVAVDGKVISGNVLPPIEDGGTSDVLVLMGMEGK